MGVPLKSTVPALSRNSQSFRTTIVVEPVGEGADMRMNLRRSLPSPTREFLKEANRRRSTVSAGQHRIRAELAKLDRQIGNLVDGVAAGADALALNVRIKTLEAERSALADTSTDDLERGLAFLVADHVAEDAAEQPDVFDQRTVLLGRLLLRLCARSRGTWLG